MEKGMVTYSFLLIFSIVAILVVAFSIIKLEQEVKEQRELINYVIESEEVYVGIVTKKEDETYWFNYTIYIDFGEELELKFVNEEVEVGDKVIVFYDEELDAYSDPILYEGE